MNWIALLQIVKETSIVYYLKLTTTSDNMTYIWTCVGLEYQAYSMLKHAAKWYLCNKNKMDTTISFNRELSTWNDTRNNSNRLTNNTLNILVYYFITFINVGVPDDVVLNVHITSQFCASPKLVLLQP